MEIEELELLFLKEKPILKRGHKFYIMKIGSYDYYWDIKTGEYDGSGIFLNGCNIWGRGKLPIFIVKLIEEHGMTKYKKLVEKANTLVQYKSIDYQNIEKFYKECLENL